MRAAATPPLTDRPTATATATAARALAALERRRQRYGSGGADARLELLRTLARTQLASAAQIRRLHEALCFLRAYPDDARMLAQVERMLERFERRADLRAHRAALAYSGIAGTVLWFPYYYATARWLAARWPHALRLDRIDTVAEQSIAKLLPLLVSPLEAHALREANLPGYAALDRLRGARTDAVFLLERIAALPGDEFTREALYDLIDPSCELSPAPGTPARTHAVFARAPRAWQLGPLQRTRPELRRELARPPRSIRRAGRADARALIDLARAAMVTRERDLDAFEYGNERDVWLIDDGDGLAFALIGMLPERRPVLPALYGGLTLHNGVPVGYHQADFMGRTAAVSFNTFDTFRGGESARDCARLLAALHFGFGASSFSIEPYQLGEGNDEGLQSGAWWFYFKLGFRPRAAAALRLGALEVARVRRQPAHRTSIEVLAQLAQHHVHFECDPAHPAPQWSPVAVGLRVGQHWAQLSARDRANAQALASRQALRLCALPSLRGFSADERRAWAALCPLIAMLPVAKWSDAQRIALVALVRAKAEPSERRYAQLLASHTALQTALSGLSRRGHGSRARVRTDAEMAPVT